VPTLDPEFVSPVGATAIVRAEVAEAFLVYLGQDSSKLRVSRVWMTLDATPQLSSAGNEW
jgi:hypothetical protein